MLHPLFLEAFSEIPSSLLYYSFLRQGQYKDFEGNSSERCVGLWKFGICSCKSIK